MRIKEIKRIDSDRLRNMCIDNNWYTTGNANDYSKMFEMCKKDNITTNQLYKIAKDIYEHTDLNRAKCCADEYSHSENILNMMIYINDCTYVFYKMVD